MKSKRITMPETTVIETVTEIGDELLNHPRVQKALRLVQAEKSAIEAKRQEIANNIKYFEEIGLEVKFEEKFDESGERPRLLETVCIVTFEGNELTRQVAKVYSGNPEKGKEPDIPYAGFGRSLSYVRAATAIRVPKVESDETRAGQDQDLGLLMLHRPPFRIIKEVFSTV